MAVRTGNSDAEYIPRDEHPDLYPRTAAFAYYGFDGNGNFCAFHTYTDANGRTYTNRTILSNPQRQYDAHLDARGREWHDILRCAEWKR